MSALLMLFLTWIGHEVLSEPVAAASPGMVLSLSEKGLQYAASVAIDEMAASIQGQVFPEQKGKHHHFHYEIKDTSVRSFTKPSSSLTVSPGHGITWSLQNAGASVHGHWEYKYKRGHIKVASDHGSFDVSASGISLTVNIGMGVDQTGRPTVSSQSCTSHVGHVKVKFHGGASWLYNIFDSTLKKPIQKKLEDVLCSSVNKALNVNAKATLAKMKIQVPVGKVFMLDYRLVAAPVFGAQFVETQHKGEFEWKAAPSDPPFQPSGVAFPHGNEKMLTICVSDYTMNTLGYVAQSHGLIKRTLTKAQLPADEQSFLNTSCTSGKCIGSFLPQLKKKFPDGSVELSLQTTSAPTLNTSSDVISANFRGQIIFNVRVPGGNLSHAFTADLEVTLPVTVAMSNNHVTAHVNSTKFKVTKTQSDIGPIPPAVLTIGFDLASRRLIVPELNDLGAKGFDLPTVDHVRFLTPDITMLKGAVCFATDVKYDTTLKFQPRGVVQ